MADSAEISPIAKHPIIAGLVVVLVASAIGSCVAYDASSWFRSAVRYRWWRVAGAATYRCATYGPAEIRGGVFTNPDGRAVEVTNGCQLTLRDAEVRGEVGVFVDASSSSKVTLVGGTVRGRDAALLGGYVEVDGTEIDGPIHASVIDLDGAARAARIEKRRAKHASATCTKDLLDCFNDAHVFGEITGTVWFTFDSSGNAVQTGHSVTLEPELLQKCFDQKRASKRIADLREGSGTVICGLGGIHLKGGDGTSFVSSAGWRAARP